MGHQTLRFKADGIRAIRADSHMGRMGQSWAWPLGRRGTSMTLTLRQAADKCGKSRSTVHRALKSGKLSGSRDDDGTWSIDPAELARVFPWDAHDHGNRDDAEHGRDGAGDSSAVLAVKVDMLEQQLERERDTVEDLRRRLDKAEERVFALSAPLSDRRQQRGPQRGLWERVRGLWE